MGQTYNPRMARGRGRFSIDRIPYVIELALPALKDFRHIILVETADPISFFAYPNKPSILKPEGCEVHRMTESGENSVAALEALAKAVGAKPQDTKPQKVTELVKPTGALTHASIAQPSRWRSWKTPSSSMNPNHRLRLLSADRRPPRRTDWLQNMGMPDRLLDSWLRPALRWPARIAR